MSSERVRIVIRCGETEVEFEGGYEDVWKSVNKFFSETYPAIEVARKLTGAVDVAELARRLEGYVEFRDGRIIIMREMDAKRRILLCLAAAYVGKRLGLFDKEHLTPKEIAAYTGLDERVARARLSELRKAGLVAKADEGLYSFTSSSISELFGEEA
jgi:DNA-binding transcriptional ArsR family regulator